MQCVDLASFVVGLFMINSLFRINDKFQLFFYFKSVTP